jgi:hypothetical protein
MSRLTVERRLAVVEVAVARLAPQPPDLALPAWLEWCDVDEWIELEAIYRRAAAGEAGDLDEARLAQIAAAGRRRQLCWPTLTWDAIERSSDPLLRRLRFRAHYDKPAGMTAAAWVYMQLEHGG